MKKLAPIGISAYHRVHHLRRTIESLKCNPEAPDSELFIFSDAPKPGDEEAVAAVRRYLKTVSGFRSVDIVERTTNGRIANSHGGRKMLVERYGRTIFMEEDIVVAPGFLSFMNEALNMFEGDPRIFAVSGYTPGMRLEWMSQEDFYLSPRFSAWGYGIWKDRVARIPRRIDDYDAVSGRAGFRERLARLGDDYRPMLEQELAHAIDAGDVRTNYLLARDDLRVVAPICSLTENIGHDGSGVHCDATHRFSVDLGRARTQHRLRPDVTDDPAVIELLRRFRSRTENTQPWQDSEILDAIREITGGRPATPTKVAGGGRPQDVVGATPTRHPPRLGDDIIFLLGLPRSGTTLLQRLLGEHAAIHTTAEPWLLLPICRMLGKGSQTADYDADLARTGIGEFLLELPGGEATLVEALREAVVGLYEKCRLSAGARYFLDKTPRYHYIIPQLLQLFPNARFVFLLRNPLAMLASVAESWFGGEVAAALAAEYHGRDLKLGPQHLAEGLQLLGDRACVIRYEALVANAETELRRLCSHLGLEFAETMLRYDPAFRYKGSFGDSIGIPQHDRASTGSVGKWKDVLLRPANVPAARGYLAELPAATVAALGYDHARLTADFETALVERVKAGACPADLLPGVIRQDLARSACEQAEQLIEQGCPDAAAAALCDALRYAPSHTRALNDIGALCWVNREPDWAIEYFRRANRADPHDRNVLLNLTAALDATGHAAAAQAAYLGYMALHPEDDEIAALYLGQQFGDATTAAAPPVQGVVPHHVGPDNFGEFSYSRRSHFAGLGLPPEHAGENLDDCNLKVYQDMLAWRFILDNFAPGAKLLEVGGGDSRVIRWLKDRYEFWNLDKLEGLGNGLTSLADTSGFRLVRDYIGNFNGELPDNYFDGVFSISTLEHVPEDEATLRAIADDIDRVLKPGGLSMHCFDITLRRRNAMIHPLIAYFHAHRPTINPPPPPWRIRLDPDLWGMSRAGYDRLWLSTTKVPFDEFGQPVSYNLLWRKEADSRDDVRATP